MITLVERQLAVTRTVYTVKEFASWFIQGHLNLRPPFQRNSVWKPKAKSYLVDTVLRGLPIPIVILRDEPGVSLEPRREVVDGQQRLTTLLAFLAPDRFKADDRFTISKAHRPEFAGRSFQDLPDQAKQLILGYEVSTHVLPSSVDDQQVLRIFSRLNATGSPLTRQELRNAQFHGAFKQFVFELSLTYLDYWRSWKLFTSEDFARMEEVEFTSELVSRILYGITATSQAQLDKLYERFEDDFLAGDECLRRFNKIFDQIDIHLADSIVASEFSRVTWFYTIFGLIHDRVFSADRIGADTEIPTVAATQLPQSFWKSIERSSDRIRNPIGLPPETVRAITGATSSLKSRQLREAFMIEIL
jgi:hypothetical protein